MAIEKITLGGGCFWCLDAAFIKLKGVQSVVSGYADGNINHPTYQQICTGTTDHAEVVQINFDPDIISFDTLLDVFFTLHDPTTLNRQGADVGSQYRSIILSHNETQAHEAEKKLLQLEASAHWTAPIVTELKRLKVFFPAESEHQNYFQINPNNRYCQAVIPPKLKKLTVEYTRFLK
jgi:peptide-methionine (S)-S-oxide reductase